jgi:hypothetical protein
MHMCMYVFCRLVRDDNLDQEACSTGAEEAAAYMQRHLEKTGITR